MNDIRSERYSAKHDPYKIFYDLGLMLNGQSGTTGVFSDPAKRINIVDALEEDEILSSKKLTELVAYNLWYRLQIIFANNLDINLEGTRLLMAPNPDTNGFGAQLNDFLIAAKDLVIFQNYYKQILDKLDELHSDYYHRVEKFFTVERVSFNKRVLQLVKEYLEYLVKNNFYKVEEVIYNIQDVIELIDQYFEDNSEI